jgi:hypothetical protein
MLKENVLHHLNLPPRTSRKKTNIFESFITKEENYNLKVVVFPSENYLLIDQ